MPLREVLCPHCFREVFVNVDAKCPACRLNADNRIDGHVDLKPMEFVDGEELPPVCVVCGDAAKSFVEVGEKNQGRGNDAVGILARIAAALGGLVAIRIKPEPYQKEWKISVKLPVCDRHRESKMLKPIYVDYDRYRIAIPTHQEFIRRWKEPDKWPSMIVSAR